MTGGAPFGMRICQGGAEGSSSARPRVPAVWTEAAFVMMLLRTRERGSTAKNLDAGPGRDAAAMFDSANF